MDILKKARDLGQAIQQCDEYQNMQKAKNDSDSDALLQSQIEEFNFIKIKLSTAMNQENKNNELLVSLDKELKEVYSEMMENENMVAFNSAKSDVDALMNNINQILMASVNGQDPETFSVSQNKGCGSGGGCGNCSGSCNS